MARKGSVETRYGPGKYAAFHLLLGVWIRRYVRNGSCVYVTLGGTELRDIQSLIFINQALASSIYSFEIAADRFQLACESRDKLLKIGIKVECVPTSIFEYKRASNERHLFFLDLEGIYDLEYARDFELLFKSNTLREGDGLLVTSHLGHNPGYIKTVFRWFEREFQWLNITDTEEKRELYRVAHPSFVLYRALEQADLIDTLSLTCFGSVQYFDTSSMGLYGYAIGAGQTQFRNFIADTSARAFSIPTVRRPTAATR